MAGNSNLGVAKVAREDEFYTQLTDIEKELRYYSKHFVGKTVFCNCDDPFESNFFKFFALNFNRLKLKKLIATCYATSPIAGQQLSLFDIADGKEEQRNKAYKAIVTKVYDATGDGGVDMFDVKELFKSHENELKELKGNGDFRSAECLSLLDEADIVVTNPPFSLFREYVATLMEHEKHFIIIGNQNAISYREIFPLLKSNQIWLGATEPNEFIVPKTIEGRKNMLVRDDGTIVAKFGNVCWFTNLDIKKRHEELIFVKRYAGNEDRYPGYANYDAIEVPKVSSIPSDYSGVMGVPLSFFSSYNPEQFEIIGMTNLPESLPGLTPIGKEWCDKYFAQGGTGHVSANMWGLVFYTSDGLAKRSYARVLIRNKHPEKQKELHE